jgi:hypothetical protein
MLVSDLAEYDPAKILAALRVCRLELNRFPTTAEIIKRMSVKSDSHTGPGHRWEHLQGNLLVRV